MLYLVIFFVIALIILALFIIKVRVVVDYKLSGLDDWGVVSFSVLGGLFKYDIKLPTGANKDAEDSIEAKDWTHGIYDKLSNIKEIYKAISKIKEYLGRKIILKILRLKVNIGTGDAYETGILSGLAWTIAGMAASYILNTFRRAKNSDSSIEVNPYFMEKKFIIELYCIFGIKLVHIIVVGIKYQISKSKKKKAKVV